MTNPAACSSHDFGALVIYRYAHRDKWVQACRFRRAKLGYPRNTHRNTAAIPYGEDHQILGESWCLAVALRRGAKLRALLSGPQDGCVAKADMP